MFEQWFKVYKGVSHLFFIHIKYHPWTFSYIPCTLFLPDAPLLAPLPKTVGWVNICRQVLGKFFIYFTWKMGKGSWRFLCFCQSSKIPWIVFLLIFQIVPFLRNSIFLFPLPLFPWGFFCLHSRYNVELILDSIDFSTRWNFSSEKSFNARWKFVVV